MQGHVVESSMPPLPKNGPTVETTVLDLDPKGLDDSPVPSANSREEEIAEATEEEPRPVVTSKKSKRRKIRLAPSYSSSPSKDTDLKDDATSHSPPRKDTPLRACPLSSMPPAPVTDDIVFGGPGSIPSLSDDEERYVLGLSSSFPLYCLSFCRVCPNFCLICSDAGDVTSPRHEAAASPARTASPMRAPTPPRPELTPTTPVPSLDKAVAIPDPAASSSRFATWEEHVSALCFLEFASIFSVRLCSYALFLQPFGHALVEAGKAFFNMEQERSTFRSVLESHAGKCFN